MKFNTIELVKMKTQKTEEQDPASARVEEPIDGSFEAQAKLPRVGLLREFFDFLRTNKKWWLTPIIVILLLMSVLIVLTNSAIAPFIYVLF